MKTARKDRVRKVRSLSDCYFELVKTHPLTAIRNDTELAAAQSVIEQLLRTELDEGGKAYLDALSILVIAFEREHFPVPKLAPHTLLAHMLEDNGMSQAELARKTGIAKATVSDLVGGKRPFTVGQMGSIAGVFNLPARFFLPKGA